MVFNKNGKDKIKVAVRLYNGPLTSLYLEYLNFRNEKNEKIEKKEDKIEKICYCKKIKKIN
jgi:hypothetical protein